MTRDVNVLVAAFRADHGHHEQARGWLSAARAACAQGQGTLTLLPMVTTSFLRLVTSPRVFAVPDAIGDAIAFVDALVASPGVELGYCGQEWPQLRDRLLTHALHGNLVTDA